MFEKPETVNLLTPGEGLRVEFESPRCGDDGTVFLNAYLIRDGRYGVTAYAVKNGDSPTVVRFDTGGSNFSYVLPNGHLAISSSRVAIPILALTAEETAEQLKQKEDESKRLVPHSYFLFFNHRGEFQRATALETTTDDATTEFDSFGMFDSGEVLLMVGSSVSSQGRHWAIMNEDGSSFRNILDEDGAKNNKLQTKQLSTALTAAIHSTQILPYRGDLVLAEMGSIHPIVEISPSGDLRTVQLKVPQGETLGPFIRSDGITWKMVLGHAAQTEPQTLEKLKSNLFQSDRIAEFDSDTGELLRYIDPGKDRDPSTIICEINGEYTAVKADDKGGTLLIEKATIR